MIRKVDENNIDDSTNHNLDHDYKDSMIRGGDETLPSSRIQNVIYGYLFICFYDLILLRMDMINILSKDMKNSLLEKLKSSKVHLA